MKTIFILILLVSVSYAIDTHDLETRAWMGDVQARYDLGVSFYRGRHHKQNYESAFYWFNQNAQAKHIASLYNVGIMFEAGDGTSKDLVQAQSYFLLAKELGDYDAEYRFDELSEKLNKSQTQAVLEWRAQFRFKTCTKAASSEAVSSLQALKHVSHKVLKNKPYRQNVICPKL